ncbi:FAD-binding oxidoreductase [Candidatus Solincola tengchongensis]|uniref:FAD-binding oxidoreductase n=1 Tax=Candidatus Solincola tengchongensis TaxID=2900693 RepID=UPI002579852B|nr:FAD-binding oxidoreductase [Candidatus Solincola tengchongensis]
MTVGTVLGEVRDIVGAENVSREASAIGKYFQDKVDVGRLTLVRPGDEYELSEVVALAGKKGIPVYSVRRERMEVAPAKGEGFIIDLSRMDGIKEIDRRNLMGHIYAGVTYERLQEECLKKDCRLLLPAAAESRSVLRSYLDRDVLNGNAVYRFPNLSIFHAVLADGRIWVSGSQQLTSEGIADFREDQGPQFSLFFGGSEDIFGIPFYGIVYLYPLREERRVLLFGFDALEPALQLAYKVNREEHCFECLIANARYLSVLLSRDAEGAERLRAKLPAWVTAFSLEHHVELVDLWEKYVRSDAEAMGARQLDGELAAAVDAQFKKPWYIFDRDYLRGRTAVIRHYDFKSRAPSLLSGLRELASKKGYPADELGQALIPVYFGGSFYCETDLYFRPSDEGERNRVEETVREGYRYLLDEKSFVDRPRGEVAEMVFASAHPGYLKVMKTFKDIVDPGGIMNPGQLLKEV